MVVGIGFRQVGLGRAVDYSDRGRKGQTMESLPIASRVRARSLVVSAIIA